MNIAKAVALRSEDPIRKVGCVIVDVENRIISAGYNNPPSGQSWKEDKSTTLHAEINAIVHAQRLLKNCTLYTTLSPCPNCAPVIAAAKIAEVIYEDVYKDGAGLRLLEELGVVCHYVGDLK